MNASIQGAGRAFGHLDSETDRTTSRDAVVSSNTRRQGPAEANMDADSPAVRVDASSRIGRRRLIRLADQLTVRDRAVLGFLNDFRFATARQLARLHANDFAGSRSAIRQTNRQLTKLESYGLARRLQRRVGGVRAGSASGVWTLTTAGCKLAQGRPEATRSDQVRRSRAVEPSLSFLDHTLAVTELRVLLAELEQEGALASVTVVPEPSCWRRCVNAAGQPVWLKPDLAVLAITTDGFEDHWFCELDRATENPARIGAKCRQYQDYHSSGREQADTGVFPAVLWITPDVKRRDQLAERITSEADLLPGLFQVITLDQFAATIRNGPAGAQTSSNKP